ncbi:MAG: hypothetical protein KF869_01205 [Phycisphaeraceae bacterium]|nr:hypothetical protein [Phycisphaeraceae bacterium]
MTQDDWVFAPVVVETQQSVQIPGVLALRDLSQAVGDNIVAVWYENPLVQGEAWTAKAWESQDQWKAIEWVKAQFDIGDEWNQFWPTSAAVPHTPTTEPPVEYFKGVLDTDPMAAWVAGSEGEEIVAVLTSIGYKSASVPVDKEGPCDTKTVLAALADTSAFAVLAHPSAAQLDDYFAVRVPLTCAQRVVPPPPPPPPVVPGTTTPQPGVPLNPGAPWQRDSRPPTYKPSCSTVTTCCYEAPIIWLYTTTNWLGLTVIRYCESQISWSCPNPSGGPCPAAPSCGEPIGPHFPPPPPGAVPCGYNYY